MSDETKKCPCCGNALKARVGIDGLTLVLECQTWGCCFRCNDTVVDKIAVAMIAQAELAALKAAIMPVVDWWKEIKPSHCTDKWPDFYILEYRGKNISLRQLE